MGVNQSKPWQGEVVHQQVRSELREHFQQQDDERINTAQRKVWKDPAPTEEQACPRLIPELSQEHYFEEHLHSDANFESFGLDFRQDALRV